MADTNRRKLLTRLTIGASAAFLAGCDKISQSAGGQDFLKKGSELAYRMQRLLAGRNALAPEFSAADIAPVFRANGTLDPGTADYQAHVANNFGDWRIKVGGLVEHPFELSMADLRAMPSRTQITRHDCVEGWSCIGQWSGAPLRPILAKAKPKENARYVLFHCADNMSSDANDPQLYYETLDLVEASHLQTILAYDLNGKPLPIANGAPVRLRAERQLGYKMAKYVNGIELVESFANIRGGNGGYWEDQGYTWWAGDLMKPEAYDFLNNLSTVWAIIIGAVMATGGGLLATWIERNVDRHHRERNAALFFGEMLSTLDVIMEFALQARGVGNPYGPITMRFLRSGRREIDIYDRNRETVFFLSDGILRARIHTVILRLAMPIDGIFDITQEIALTEAQLKALPAGDPDREDIAKRIEELRQRRDTSFDFVGETAAQLKAIIADLEPIARQSFRQLAQVARS